MATKNIADFVADFFAEHGKLAQIIKGYRPRHAQQVFTNAVAENLKSGGVLLAEAGTGTGKTFAYLLPALLLGKKILISTASKNLQEQIFRQDLPRMQQATRSGVQVALLKGRRNYLCPLRYEQYCTSAPKREEEKHWRAALAQFYLSTADGDLAHLEDIPENAPIMSQITSTADNCLGRDCSFFDECFVQKARQNAKNADVVIVNHHLLLADFSLKADGFAEILPTMDAFIIDEAHHLPKMAVQFLGEHFSTRQLLSFLEDCKTAILTDAPDLFTEREFLKDVELQNNHIFLTLAEQPIHDEETLFANASFWTQCEEMRDKLSALEKMLGAQIQRGKLIANVEKRCEILINRLNYFLTLAKQQQEEKNLLSPQGVPQAIWLERNLPRHFVLSAVPVNASETFSKWVAESEASWTFTSATLAANGNFDHFSRELGLHDYRSLILSGTFDYPRQSLLYQPPDLPDPNSPSYTKAMIQAVLPILERTQGRAFLLFTSYRALNVARKALENENFSLLVQGDAPKAQLLAEFRKMPRAVLLATSSFWEGVDVRGDKLVCVVIDKLPFTAPNDPITKARHELLKQQGLSPFMHDSLPEAIITLKQGVGRLIRDVDDYGVLVIADPRLTGKNYGKDFLNSLPNMSKTRKIEVIDRFFTLHEGKQ